MFWVCVYVCDFHSIYNNAYVFLWYEKGIWGWWLVAFVIVFLLLLFFFGMFFCVDILDVYVFHIFSPSYKYISYMCQQWNDLIFSSSCFLFICLMLFTLDKFIWCTFFIRCMCAYIFYTLLFFMICCVVLSIPSHENLPKKSTMSIYFLNASFFWIDAH